MEKKRKNRQKIIRRDDRLPDRQTDEKDKHPEKVTQ